MSQSDDLDINIGVGMRRLAQQIARVEAQFNRAAAKQERRFLDANKKISRDYERMTREAQRQMAQIQPPGLPGVPGLGRIGGIMAGAISTRELVRMTDTWTDLSARVGLAVGEMSKAPEVMGRIAEMARRTYSPLEATAESWLANSTALRELGMSTGESLDFTEALNNALVVSGAKAQRAASVQDALAKAMALGTLSGQNLNTVIASGGRVAELLAAELGVGVNQLRKLGGEGKITGDVIDRALRGNLAQLRAEAEAMPATISDGLLLLKNAVLEYVGATDKGLGASARLANALVFLADNLDLVVAAGGILAGRVLGPAMLAMLVRISVAARAAAAGVGAMGTAAGAAAGGFAALRTAVSFLGGPIGVVLAGLTALPLITTTSADRVEGLRRASSEAVSALDAFAQASERAKREQAELGGSVTAATEAMLTQSRAALQASRDKLQKQMRDARHDALGLGINPTNRSEVNLVRNQFLLHGRNLGGVFQEIVDLMNEVERGSRSLGSVSSRLEQIAGAGEEVAEAVAEYQKAISDGRSADTAIRHLMRLASSIGGFEREIAEVERTAGTSGAAAAVAALAAAMEQTAAAGGVLRDNDHAVALRSLANTSADAEQAVDQLNGVLDTTIEVGEALEALNPMAGIEAGANAARSAVLSLNDAIEALPREITTTIRGLENASDSVTASAALLRQFEGFRETPYWDVNAHRVGFGSDTITLSDGTIQRVTQGMRVSVEDANRDLSRRIGEFQGVIVRQIGEGAWSSFNTAQQAALTSIAYNYGSLPDRVVAAIRSGNNQSVVTSIASLQDHNDGVNRDRRLAEAAIFRDGVGVESAARRQEADDARRLADAERDREQASRDAEKAAKDAAEERAKLLKEEAESRADLLAQAERQIQDAEFELHLVGRSAAEQARLRAEYMLTNDAKERGIDLTEKIAGSERTYGEAIRETAAQMGEYAAKMDELAQVQQAAAEREEFLARMQNDLKNGILDSIVAARSFTDVLGNLAQALARAAMEAALFGSGPFGGRGGGLLSGLMGMFGGVRGDDALSAALRGTGAFGGFRANGGPVSPGRAYVVGEHRPELFVPRQPGTILPRVPEIADSSARLEVSLSPELVIGILEQANGDAVQIMHSGLKQFARTAAPDVVKGVMRGPRRRG